MWVMILTLIYLSTPIQLSVYPSIYLPIYLSTYLPVYLSTCLPVYLSGCLSACLSVCMVGFSLVFQIQKPLGIMFLAGAERIHMYMGVSINGESPKWLVYNGKSY